MNRVKDRGGWEFLKWTDEDRAGFTWNPASGCDGKGCAVKARGVCWAEKIVKRLGHICPKCPSFKPHMHDGREGTPDRRYEPLQRKKPSNITPVSTGDLFGLKENHTNEILHVIREASWHYFMILTKLPHNALHSTMPYNYPDNVWFGVSVNQQDDTWRLDTLRKIRAQRKWVIFEPLYSPIDYDLRFLDWIIIGAQTRPELQPEKAWVESILVNAKGVPIWMKTNLNWPWVKRREHP